MVILIPATSYAQTVQDRLRTLEAQIERLRGELDALKRETATLPQTEAGSAQTESVTKATNRDFVEQIIVPDLGADESAHEFEGRPETFLQTRFSKGSVPHADSSEIERNFQLTRIEVRWSGKVSPRVGVGLELQLHPALEGSADEIVNDAFIEFYPVKGLTLRAGQFVKPFGFDVQQSSSRREYPERAMFEGYFFPGERDRGVLLQWTGGETLPPIFRNTTVSAALLNGNRFFSDFDSGLDGVFRIRRLIPQWGLAVGASAQVGTQRVPPGISAGNDSKIFGLDLQYAFRRFGTRVEVVRGTRPSTLLSREPEFTSAFLPGSKTSGAAVSGFLSLTSRDQLYLREDLLFGDPMTANSVRATSAGYLRFIGEGARIGLNYQWKNRPTFNDDAVNSRFQATLGMVS